MSSGPFSHDAAHMNTRLECKRLWCHISWEVGIKQVELGESLQCQTLSSKVAQNIVIHQWQADHYYCLPKPKAEVNNY